MELLDGTIAAATTQTVLLPATVMIGDATLTIDHTGSAARRTSWQLWSGIGGAATLFCIVALPVAWLAMSELPTLTTSSVGRPLSTAKLDDARRRIEARLAQSGLGPLQIETRPGGLVIQGAVGADEYRKWRALRGELRADEPAFALLADQVSMQQSERAPQHLIGAVSRMPAFIVTTDGRRVKIGESIGDGWIVRDIAADRVVLERGTTRTVMEF